MASPDDLAAVLAPDVEEPDEVVLDDEALDRLATMLRAGNYVTVAARAVGVSPDRLAEWLERGASSHADDRGFVELRERLDRARADAEVRHVALVAAAAAENWQAAAWLLERQYPDRWSRPTLAQFRIDEEPPTHSADALDELAERRAVRRAVAE
jgi:hypothetical protein